MIVPPTAAPGGWYRWYVLGPLQATTQDLVTLRLRGTAFAVFSLGPNIIGLG